MPDLSAMTPEQREAYKQYLRDLVAGKESTAADAAVQGHLARIDAVGAERDAAQRSYAPALAAARDADSHNSSVYRMGALTQSILGNGDMARQFGQAASDRPFESSATADQRNFLQYLEQKAKLATDRGGLGVAQAGKTSAEALQQLGNFERETQTRAAMAAENQLKRAQEQEQFAERMEDRRLTRAEAAQRAREHNQMMRDISEQRGAASREAKTEAQAAKAGAALDKDTEALSKRLEKSGFAQQAIAEVDKYLSNDGSDLPGYGRVGGMVPDLVASSDANALRASILNLSDALLRARTGANAPQSEVENVQRMYGIQRGAPEDVVRAGLKRLRNDTLAAMKQAEAGYSPEVVETFKKRGGVASDSVAGQTPSGMVIVETAKGTRGAIPAGNVEAFLKKNAGSRVVSQ